MTPTAMGGELQPEDNPERMLQLARFEQLRLQNEKLRFELASLGGQKPWYIAPTQMAPMITALVAFVGFAWGLVQYSSEQDKNRTAQKAQSDREQKIADREFMRPWIESQRETYLQALTAAATIPDTIDPKAKRQATDTFWGLYHGKMVMIETKDVSGAMVQYGHCLNGVEICSKKIMEDRCLTLATAMAGSMAATAKMTYEEFTANQFQYVVTGR